MNWDELGIGDLFPAILLVAILIVGAVVWTKHPPYTPYNLGPDWECTRVPKGGSGCFRKQPDKPLNSNQILNK